MNKKVVIVVSVLLYVISSYVSFTLFSGSIGQKGGSPVVYNVPKDENGNIVVDETLPKTEECPINGEMLTKSHAALWSNRRPLIVMVENSLDARPQSGLTSADVVYEAVAEGGITRFATVFFCKDSPFVGPVRSARVYFIDFASEYGQFPLYTHVGGANCNSTTGSGCLGGAPADALGKIQKLKWYAHNDLNHVAFPVMWRDYDRLPGRVTEHTVYSSTKKLWDYAAKSRKLTQVDKNGKRWDEKFSPWKFKDDEKASTPISKISFDFWEGKGDYSVVWNYDPTTNAYKRFNGGAPHIDKNNDKQITSHNVVVAFMKESTAKDGYQGGGSHMLYQTTGSGKSIVFQDGAALTGTWKKKDPQSHIKFYDKAGKEIALNRGQVFIEILPEGNKVDY